MVSLNYMSCQYIRFSHRPPRGLTVIPSTRNPVPFKHSNSLFSVYLIPHYLHSLLTMLKNETSVYAFLSNNEHFNSSQLVGGSWIIVTWRVLFALCLFQAASIMQGSNGLQPTLNAIKIEAPSYYCNSYTPPGPDHSSMLQAGAYSKTLLSLWPFIFLFIYVARYVASWYLLQWPS